MVTAIAHEIRERASYLSDNHLQSIYFGGGTPSLLDKNDLDLLFAAIRVSFTVADDAEITLEANPDDLTTESLSILSDSPINRLSIGIQSFSEEDLRFMNRAHSAAEAANCIEAAQLAGFDNLTVDLIYGSPTTSDTQWAENVQTLIDYGIAHLSCYALTVELQTALDHFVRKGQAPPVDEEQAARQFEYLIATLTAAGYIHYEISNFAQADAFARHNSSYWKGEPYLGVGPSAHSFDGESRQWNVANNAKYLKAINGDLAQWPVNLYEREVLSPTDHYNEQVLTGLRTIWGVDVSQLADVYKQHFLQHIHQFVDKGLVKKTKNNFQLSVSGRLLADHIAASVFY